MKKQTIVISLGGSIICPGKIDVNFLREFKKIILSYAKNGNRAIVICGGGETNRLYNNAAKEVRGNITHEELDWIGIDSTRLNARLVRTLIGSAAEEKLLENPYTLIRSNKSILVGCGYKPGSTSDKDAVIAARTYKADTVLNLSNIDYVFTKDPRKYKSAKPIVSCTWQEMKKIIGDKYVPRGNYPFGPPAAKLAEQLGLRVVIMNGKNIKNLKSFLQGGEHKGTTVQ